MGSYGDKPPLIIEFGPYDAAAVIDRIIGQIPLDAGCTYIFRSGRAVWTTNSTSGTVRPRVIRATSTEAPGATASATCIELADALITNTGANTPVNWTPVAGVIINPGDRICIDAAGTMTNLVGYQATIVLEPYQYRV